MLSYLLPIGKSLRNSGKSPFVMGNSLMPMTPLPFEKKWGTAGASVLANPSIDLPLAHLHSFDPVV